MKWSFSILILHPVPEAETRSKNVPVSYEGHTLETDLGNKFCFPETCECSSSVLFFHQSDSHLKFTCLSAKWVFKFTKYIFFYFLISQTRKGALLGFGVLVSKLQQDPNCKAANPHNLTILDQASTSPFIYSPLPGLIHFLSQGTVPWWKCVIEKVEKGCAYFILIPNWQTI